MEATSSKRKRTQLSVSDKKAICDLRADHPKLKQDDLLVLIKQKLGLEVPRTTLIGILLQMSCPH